MYACLLLECETMSTECKSLARMMILIFKNVINEHANDGDNKYTCSALEIKLFFANKYFIFNKRGYEYATISVSSIRKVDFMQ